MNAKEVGFLSCRILAIFTLTQQLLPALGYIIPQTFYPQAVPHSDGGYIFSTAAQSVVLLAIIVSLWIFADRIADYMTAGFGFSRSPLSLDSRTIMGIAITIAGIYILTNAVLQFYGELFYLMFFRESSQNTPDLQYRHISDITLFFMKLAVGLYMVMKPYFIVDYLQKKQEKSVFSVSQDE